MFVLQHVVVVVMALMGPAVQAAIFHKLSCFLPAKGHDPLSCTHWEGPEGPAAPGAPWGRLECLCLTFGSFSPLPVSAAAAPAFPSTRAWLWGNAGCTEGPFESRLEAAWHPSLGSPWPSPPKSLSFKGLGAALGPIYPWHMQGGGKVAAGLCVGMLYPLVASISSGTPQGAIRPCP